VPASVVLRARQVLGRIEANSHVAVGLQQGQRGGGRPPKERGGPSESVVNATGDKPPGATGRSGPFGDSAAGDPRAA